MKSFVSSLYPIFRCSETSREYRVPEGASNIEQNWTQNQFHRPRVLSSVLNDTDCGAGNPKRPRVVVTAREKMANMCVLSPPLLKKTNVNL